MANNNNIILDNLNGEYVKFYATNNGALKTLLNNSGNIIIYQDFRNDGTNRIYTYLGDVLLSSGVGFTDETSYENFIADYKNKIIQIDDNSENIIKINEIIKLNQESIENLSYSYINVPNTNGKQIKLTYTLFNKIIPEYKTPEIIKEYSYIEYSTNAFSKNKNYNNVQTAYSYNSVFNVPKNSFIHSINRNVVVKNNDEIITYYSSIIQKNYDSTTKCISNIIGSKESEIDTFNIVDYDYKTSKDNYKIESFDNKNYSQVYNNRTAIDKKTISYSSYLYTSGTLKIKNANYFNNIYIKDNITYININTDAKGIASYEHYKTPSKLALSDLYVYNYPYITTYTFNNDGSTYSCTYSIITENDLDKRICITNEFTNNADKNKNICYIHKDFFIKEVEMFDKDVNQFQNVSGLTIIDNNYDDNYFNKYIINTGRYYNTDIYITLSKTNNVGNNYSGLSWNTIQSNDYNHSHWITYNETITSSNISYLTNLTPITYNFTDKIDPNKIINYNSTLNLRQTNKLYVPKFYKDKSVLVPSNTSNKIFGYNLPDEKITYYKDLEYSYFDVNNYSGIKFNYDIIYLGNNMLTNPEYNFAFNFGTNIRLQENTAYFIDSSIQHNLLYSSTNYNRISYLTLPNNYTVTGYLSIGDPYNEIKQPLDIYVTGENEKLFTYTTDRYYNYKINKDNYNNLDTAGKTVKINLCITNDIA